MCSITNGQTDDILSGLNIGVTGSQTTASVAITEGPCESHRVSIRV